MIVKKCTVCLVPETVDFVTFDIDGVCSVCRQVEQKDVIDWEQRALGWILLLMNIGTGIYDCMFLTTGKRTASFSFITLCENSN